VPREISVAEPENLIPGYVLRPLAFHDALDASAGNTIRWGAFSAPCRTVPRSLCCRASDKSVTRFAPNDDALGVTTRSTRVEIVSILAS
jgi:hypothetical protein